MLGAGRGRERSGGAIPGAEPGRGGPESSVSPPCQQGEGNSRPPPPVGRSGARVYARGQPAGHRRPPPGAAGSRRAGMPPLLAPLLCLALLPALAARGRRPRARNFPRLRKLLAAPYARAPGGWEQAAGGGGGRATRGGVGAGVVDSGRKADPSSRRLPHGAESRCSRLEPSLGTGLKSGLKAGMGRWGPGRPSPGLALRQSRVGLAARAGGRESCLLLFVLNRASFGFLLL